MAEVLMEFPQLTMSMPDGREESIMKRTCLVGGRQYNCLGHNSVCKMILLVKTSVCARRCLPTWCDSSHTLCLLPCLQVGKR